MIDMAIPSQLFTDNLGFPSQDLGMENTNNVCGLKQFSFNLQETPEKPFQYQPTMQFHHQHVQSLQQQQGGISMPDVPQTMSFSQSLASLMEKQSLEIDRFVMFQTERLKWALQEQGKQQLSFILKKYEARVEFLMRQKDEEFAKAVNKKVELEEFMKRVEIENQAWQKIAKENEEMVLSLSNTIQQLRESVGLFTNEVEDAESCCENRGNRATESSIQVKKEESLEISKKVLCKGCNIRSSCIIILPCRHLCLCQTCETFLHSCPVCGTEKKATIQALI